MKTAVKKPTYTEVRELAFMLGKRDRKKLHAELNADLEPKSVDDMDDAELAAELNRRYDEAMRDPTTASPWPEVRKRLWKRALEGN